MRKLYYAILGLLYIIGWLFLCGYVNAAGLLTGQTPASYSLPSGWSLLRTQDFESGCGANESCGVRQGGITTTRAHGGTHSVGGTYTKDADSVGWQRYGDVNTFNEIYVSWYDWTDSGAVFNDEYFLARFSQLNGGYQEIITNFMFSGINQPTGILTPMPQGLVSDNYGPFSEDGGSITYPLGEWVQWEIHYRPNTFGCTPTDNPYNPNGACADGFFRIYKNGTLLRQYENHRFNGVSMDYMTIQVGGDYTKLVWTYQDPNVVGASACDVPAQCAPSGNSDGCRNYMGWEDTPFSAPKCGAALSNVNRYIDDIIVMSTGGSSPPPGDSDTTPPYVSGRNPADGATGVPVSNRTITFHVKDDRTNDTGVANTISAIIDGTPRNATSVPPLTCTGSSGDKTCTYTNGTDWAAGTYVTVTISASDIASNAMTPYSYTFRTAFGAVAGTKTKAQVLAYLAGLPNQSVKKVLSGQMIGYCGGGSEGSSATWLASIASKSGHYPALYSGNYAEMSGCDTGSDIVSNTNVILKAHWNAGGLVEVSYHGNNPATGTWENETAPDFADLLDTGTVQGGRWLDQMDRLAVGLQDLEDAGVVVLFRPFIEVTGNWFWYHTGSASEMKALWVYTHNYLTNTKGLSNLLWVFGAAQQPWGHLSSEIYPGSSYVDIVGTSSYPETVQHGSMASWYSGWAVTDVQWLIDTGKPYAFTEMGLCNYDGCASPQYLPTIISDIKTYVPSAVYWSNWNATWSLDYGTNVSALLNDSWVVNRDDNPSGVLVIDNTPLTISTSVLPSGVVGTVYSGNTTITAVGGVSPYTFTVVSGSLPSGIMLTTSGILSGIPTGTFTMAQDYSFTVRVTDAVSATDDQAYTLRVNPKIPGGGGTWIGYSTDTYINSGSPSVNYSSDNTLIVYVWPAGATANKMLLRFAIDNVPTYAEVSSATLKMKLANPAYTGSGGSNPARLYVSRSTTFDPAFATWTNFSSTVGVYESYASVPLVADNLVMWNVTAAVAWAIANADNVYLVVSPETFGIQDTNRIFYSNESGKGPELTINYMLFPPPGNPSISAPGKIRISQSHLKSWR